MAEPIVAIVGRPNVGKSQLFNKIAGRRISIVEDTPGVTRDRIYARTEWAGRKFTLIDTGGIEMSSNEELLTKMRVQAEIAIELADVIVFLTDVRDGVTTSDRDVGSMLLKSGKKIVLACNKADTPGEPPMEYYEFYNLGLGDPVRISALHGLGTGDLLDEVVSSFEKQEQNDDEDELIHVAVIGKPNVGKSSLINRLLGEERLIVSDIAGTTRDAIDTTIEKNGKRYVFIDTAGVRKRSKIHEKIEKYSVIRAFTAVDRADVCLMMIDATTGVTEQDTKIAGYAHESGKGIIIVVNKWDIFEKETNSMANFRDDLKEDLGFMTYAPSLFVSAKTGQRTENVYEMIDKVSFNQNLRITTGKLNDVIGDAVLRVQPPSDKGKRLKVMYGTQVSVKPPTFIIFVNDVKLMHFSYQRYLENQLRDVFGFEGTPIRIMVRERGREE